MPGTSAGASADVPETTDIIPDTRFFNIDHAVGTVSTSCALAVSASKTSLFRTNKVAVGDVHIFRMETNVGMVKYHYPSKKLL